MEKIEIIGNLGADIREEIYNGEKFYAFNVGCSYGRDDKKVTTWYSCSSSRLPEGMLQYMVRGKKVFVRGIPRYRVFDSAKFHCKMVGVSIIVQELELLGDAAQQTDTQQAEAQQTESTMTAEENVQVY